MSRVVIYPYKMGSAAARDLAQSVGLRRVYPDGTFKPHNGDIIINWGSTRLPQWEGWRGREYTWLNHPSSVALAANKISTFSKFEEHNVPTVPFTTQREVAEGWASDGASSAVIERHCVTCSGGVGIKVIPNGGRLSNNTAALYTRYVRQAEEFRVHVWRGGVIDYARKARSRSVPDDQVDWRIRNHANGFVFVRNGVTLPTGADDVAIRAVSALALDFGAVDVIQPRTSSQVLALEVNTAPGLEGSTLENYAGVVRGVVESIQT